MVIDEWRNLVVPINRLPLDVLCLIPTHLPSQGDRLRVTFFCRHWRKTFLQYPALWSRLRLTGRIDGHIARTLLERAKGSPLHIAFNSLLSPFHNLTILSPFAQQIRSLKLDIRSSGEVKNIFMVIPGPLPLLHTLEIDATGDQDSPETFPLFNKAEGLKNFLLHINHSPSLCNFTFPNLTTFNFLTWAYEIHVSQLLDFLEASPTLRWVRMRIATDLLHEDVPPERVVTLPCVNTFFLDITGYGPGCEIGGSSSFCTEYAGSPPVMPPQSSHM